VLALQEYVPIGFIHIEGQPTPVWAETQNGDLIVGRNLSASDIYRVRKADVTMVPAKLPDVVNQPFRP